MIYKQKIFTILLASILLVTGCGGKNSDNNKEQPRTAPQKLTIQFVTDPKEIQVGQETKLIATVAKGAEPVKDADVEMEIWRDGEEQHQKLKAAPDNKGGYVTKQTFAAAGSYHATIHTTTSEIHQMPTFDFQVGAVSASPNPPQPAHDEHHGNLGLEIQFNLNPKVKVNQETVLKVRLQQDHKPFTGADVHFEYWKTNAEKHDYTAAMEQTPGEYGVPVVLTEAGAYNVRVHVKKGELHDHKETTLQTE
ncbi:hypothetical protein EFBL_3242 [Effusibacillus lacus]|uniref:YtkA-like domain-containing protein n=2 Tax=Effusibacillus lacus TaxID=1348429 RepID=A0A292YEG7_9BACL|nr:hypothetical protein EFBL_3242 [Effusibacillus lacus]